MKYYKILSTWDETPIIWLCINHTERYTIHVSQNEVSKISVAADIDKNWIASDRDEFLAAAKVAMSNLQNILSNE